MWQWVDVDGRHRRFIKADLLQWEEAEFDKRKKKRGKPVFIGKRAIVAEVLNDVPDAKGLICLLVRGCTVTASEAVGKDVKTYKPKTEIKRAVKTILRGNPKRLVWTDETARSIVASKFIGPPP